MGKQNYQNSEENIIKLVLIIKGEVSCLLSAYDISAYCYLGSVDMKTMICPVLLNWYSVGMSNWTDTIGKAKNEFWDR